MIARLQNDLELTYGLERFLRKQTFGHKSKVLDQGEVILSFTWQATQHQAHLAVAEMKRPMSMTTLVSSMSSDDVLAVATILPTNQVTLKTLPNGPALLNMVTRKHYFQLLKQAKRSCFLHFEHFGTQTFKFLKIVTGKGTP